MSQAFSILALILILGLVVIIHEWGHFLLAKLNGVGVIEFSVGFGPRLFSFVKNGTRYSLKAVPFGGSCQLLGNDFGLSSDDPDVVHDDAHAFSKKNVWSRISIIAAGPVFNFLLAYVLAVIVISFAGIDRPTVAGVMDGYPAAEAGLQAGDRITRINNTGIHLYRDVQLYTVIHEGEELFVTFVRDGEKMRTVITPVYSEEDGRYLLGIYGSGRTPTNWYETLGYSWQELRFNVKEVLDALGMIFTGRLPLTSFSGPVGMAGAVNDIVDEVNADTAGESALTTAYYMFLNLASFALMISANLGVMNLLPIPAMDGGRLVFLFLEAIRGKPVPPEKEAIVHTAGILFLFGFMIFIMGHDIWSIFQ